MEERLKNGEEVLIFRNVSDVYLQKEIDFIKGIIISSEISKNLTGNKEKPSFTWVYTVIGEDEKKYTCCNGMIIYGNDFIRRPIDYLKDLRERYKNNLLEINRLKDINEKYAATIEVIDKISQKKISQR